jgi:hypothetical protein
MSSPPHRRIRPPGTCMSVSSRPRGSKWMSSGARVSTPATKTTGRRVSAPQYTPGYYGAFLRDPDGNSTEAVRHEFVRSGGHTVVKTPARPASDPQMALVATRPQCSIPMGRRSNRRLNASMSDGRRAFRVRCERLGGSPARARNGREAAPLDSWSRCNGGGVVADLVGRRRCETAQIRGMGSGTGSAEPPWLRKVLTKLVLDWPRLRTTRAGGPVRIQPCDEGNRPSGWSATWSVARS